MTDEHKLLLDAVHRGFKSGDGTAALVYADYCEETDQSCPEFFRLLGRRLRGEEREWVVEMLTATEAGGGRWSSATPANRYIYKSLCTAAVILGHKLIQHRSWVGLTPAVAARIGRSTEVFDYANTYQYDHNKHTDRILSFYHLPHMLYGACLWVFDHGVLPDDYVVLIDETVKAMCVFTECI